MKKLVVVFGLGAVALLAALIFGVGYFLYALIPQGEKWMQAAQDGVFIIEDNGRKIERRLSRECVAEIEKMTTAANLWNLFQSEDWQSLMPERCRLDFGVTPTDEATPGENAAPETDLEWESQGADTI